MQTHVCSPSPVCTEPRVYRAPCVPSPVCTEPRVYRAPCVPSPVCTEPRVYRAPCVPSPVCPSSEFDVLQSRPSRPLQLYRPARPGPRNLRCLSGPAPTVKWTEVRLRDKRTLIISLCGDSVVFRPHTVGSLVRDEMFRNLDGFVRRTERM